MCMMIVMIWFEVLPHAHVLVLLMILFEFMGELQTADQSLLLIRWRKVWAKSGIYSNFGFLSMHRSGAAMTWNVFKFYTTFRVWVRSWYCWSWGHLLCCRFDQLRPHSVRWWAWFCHCCCCLNLVPLFGNHYFYRVVLGFIFFVDCRILILA